MTPELLDACTGCGLMVANSWASPLTDAMARAFITTPKRQAMFLAQVGHESAGFSVLEEDLDYSAEGLLATFPSHFDAATAAQYARKPVDIANRVYAGRMGNGDEASGDGWTFHGRGLIQLTGRANYTDADKALNLGLLERPDLLAVDFDAAARTAGWYWDARSLNAPADAEDLKAVTQSVNGGLNGLDDRLARYQKARAALGLTPWVAQA